MVSINTLVILLVYVIAVCGILPLFPWLETLPRLILLAGFAAGVWQDRRVSRSIRDWMLTSASVPLFIYFAVQFSRSNPVQPVVSLLAIMLAVRLAGSKSSRHCLQIAALSLFCLASSSLYDLGLQFLVYLILLLFLVALLLVLQTFFDQDHGLRLSRRELRRIISAALLMPLASLPLLVFFFPILPRTQLPLWNFLAAPTSRVASFSDTVEPGSSSSQGMSRVLAFRAETVRLPQQQLYWRGTVFNRVDGRRWSRIIPPPELIEYGRARIAQTVFPEPGGNRSLLALDAPALIALPRSRRLPDGIYEYNGPVGKRFSYQVESTPSGLLPVKGSVKRSFYLQLPATVSPRIRQLADSIRRQGGSDRQRLELVEQYFRTGSFRYSRTGLPTGEQALDAFVFDVRQGHCEFFASSFALILRSAGVPARLVGGYLGGEYNQAGGYYLVTEDMAHVWVEAYLEGQGWQRVDPSALAVNADAVWAPPKRSLVQRMRLALDALDHNWNRTVIPYDFERQFETARTVANRVSRLDPARLKAASLPVLGLILSVLALVTVYVLRHRLFASREERLLQRFYRAVERDCGLRVERGRVGLYEIAVRTGNARVREFVDMYAGVVYRDRRLNEQEYRRLRSLLSSGFIE